MAYRWVDECWWRRSGQRGERFDSGLTPLLFHKIVIVNNFYILKKYLRLSKLLLQWY